jgi:hypothetical protein
MSSSAPGEITRLVRAWQGGKEEALSQLVPAVYGELRRVAHRAMRRQRSEHTLQTRKCAGARRIEMMPPPSTPIV